MMNRAYEKKIIGKLSKTVSYKNHLKKEEKNHTFFRDCHNFVNQFSVCEQMALQRKKFSFFLLLSIDIMNHINKAGT